MQILSQQVLFRCDKEMKIFLINLGDYSIYIRDLINKDRLEKLDPKFISQKKAELKAEIKKLEDLEKTKNVDQNQIHELLSYHAPSFKQNAPFRTDAQRIKFIEKGILPELKRHGSKSTAKEIDEILLNWPEGG